MKLTSIGPDDAGDGLVAELGHVELAGEEDVLAEVAKVPVLGDDVLIGARHEEAAVVGIARPDHSDVGEVLKYNVYCKIHCLLCGWFLIIPLSFKVLV